MAWLEINNYGVSVLQNRANLTHRPIGETGGRAFSGKYHQTNRGFKREWNGFTTPPLDAETAIALEGLLRGEGHYWGFENSSMYSSKGVPKASGGVSAYTVDPKYGGGAVSVTLANIATWPLGADFSDKWTAMTWYRFGSTWVHRAVNDNGDVWENGAEAGSGGLSYLDIQSDGTLRLHGGVTGNIFDDLVVFPFRVPTAMISAFYSANRAFSSLPALELTGDCVPDTDPIEVYGRDVGEVFTPAAVSGATFNTTRTISFSLIER